MNKEYNYAKSDVIKDACYNHIITFKDIKP